MSTSQNPERQVAEQLAEALTTLERMLMNPLVPGELVSWFQSVQLALGTVGPLLHARMDREHKSLLQEIVSQDVELANRVDKLRAEADEIQASFAALEGNVGKLTVAANQKEPREDLFNDLLKKLVSEGLQFVARIRTQEAAIDTWYREAMLRDRGVGD